MIEPTSRPRKIELGSIELTIFPQPPEDRKEENNNSIGLRVKYGSFSVLLTGDSEETERQWWLKHDPELMRNCTILKLAHHGSRNGTDARWLQTVRPELAVASLGKNNEYGHPHSETISLLRRAGLPLLRTDQLGTITITSDGRTLAGGRAYTGEPRASHAGGYRPSAPPARRPADGTRSRTAKPTRHRQPRRGAHGADRRRLHRRSFSRAGSVISRHHRTHRYERTRNRVGHAPERFMLNGPSVGAPACGLGA